LPCQVSPPTKTAKDRKFLTAKEPQMTAAPQDHLKKTFTFTHQGKDFTIPAFTALPIGVIRKARKGKDEGDTAFIILETVMGEDSAELAAVDAMDQAEFQQFLEAWTQGAGVGEA
jgi:hypothetical protein